MSKVTLSCIFSTEKTYCLRTKIQSWPGLCSILFYKDNFNTKSSMMPTASHVAPVLQVVRFEDPWLYFAILLFLSHNFNRWKFMQNIWSRESSQWMIMTAGINILQILVITVKDSNLDWWFILVLDNLTLGLKSLEIF